MLKASYRQSRQIELPPDEQCLPWKETHSCGYELVAAVRRPLRRLFGLVSQDRRRSSFSTASSTAPRGLRSAAGLDAAKALTTNTRLFTLAESLGGIESLIEHPGVMTHASVAGSPLEVPDDLVRLSVGIETGDDLVADLEQALDQI